MPRKNLYDAVSGNLPIGGGTREVPGAELVKDPMQPPYQGPGWEGPGSSSFDEYMQYMQDEYGFDYGQGATDWESYFGDVGEWQDMQGAYTNYWSDIWGQYNEEFPMGFNSWWEDNPTNEYWQQFGFSPGDAQWWEETFGSQEQPGGENWNTGWNQMMQDTCFNLCQESEGGSMSSNECQECIEMSMEWQDANAAWASENIFDPAQEWFESEYGTSYDEWQEAGDPTGSMWGGDYWQDLEGGGTWNYQDLWYAQGGIPGSQWTSGDIPVPEEGSSWGQDLMGDYWNWLNEGGDDWAWAETGAGVGPGGQATAGPGAAGGNIGGPGDLGTGAMFGGGSMGGPGMEYDCATQGPSYNSAGECIACCTSEPDLMNCEEMYEEAGGIIGTGIGYGEWSANNC